MPHAPLHGPLAALQLDPSFLQGLPADPLDTPMPRQVDGAVYSFCMPTAVTKPTLLAWESKAANLLGLAGEPDDPGQIAEVFSGNRLLAGSRPYATCYGGHQFGQWAGQLGDGRALTLGSAIGAEGKRWEVQLKGAGGTPYSRYADGRAVLRSSIREYVCSEAMHHLGVPSTRALCLVGTGEEVVRDMFYDGHPAEEPGAIVTRLAPSFLRFGHFEIFAARGELDVLRRLADYTITTFFPDLGPPSPETYVAWFDEVCRRTAELVAHWLRVGFVHGVMNTDNMSILGLTIDYGPYGWLDNFDRAFTPNTSDRGGRYAYGNQARIAAWNLQCLGRALLPLTGEAKPLENCLARYADHFENTYLGFLHDKLGLPREAGEDAGYELIGRLFERFEEISMDMTIFFRKLSLIGQDMPREGAMGLLAGAFYTEPAPLIRDRLAGWLGDWQALLAASPESPEKRLARMNRANPWLIPRNWLAQQAIEAAQAGDLTILARLMRAIRHPYEESGEFSDLAGRRPDWAEALAGCNALSCSS
jgi:serine/tyrosine/threonine adenylyltransferase